MQLLFERELGELLKLEHETVRSRMQMIIQMISVLICKAREAKRVSILISRVKQRILVFVDVMGVYSFCIVYPCATHCLLLCLTLTCKVNGPYYHEYIFSCVAVCLCGSKIKMRLMYTWHLLAALVRKFL